MARAVHAESEFGFVFDSLADAITFGAEKTEKKLVDEFGKVKGKKVLAYNAESDLTDYLQLYNDLSK